MVYVVSILGFIMGFIAGQALLLVLLRHKSKKELVENKNIHWGYGLLNWAIACLGAYICLYLYSNFWPF